MILERLLTRIQAGPGVQSAALNRCAPFTGCSRTTLFLADRPNDRDHLPVVGRHYISADYFATLGIPLRAGRRLTSADRLGSPPVTVVNATAARRFWPGQEPIGKRVWFGGGTGFMDPAHPAEVVGVVGDVKYEDVDQPIGPDFYTSYLQYAFPDSMVILKPARPDALMLPALRTAVAEVDSTIPIYDVLTLEDRVGDAMARPRFNTVIVLVCAGVALGLAALGVYGVLSYAVSARQREIGIRLALGADGPRVVRLILGEGVRLALFGAGLGLGGALLASRWIQGLVFDVRVAEPRLLGGVALLITAVAAAAAYLPARRASRVDPAVVLRND
jgi:predicted permease